MNSHDFSAFERLDNMRKHASRVNKVIAKRAIRMAVKPSVALRWARSTIKHMKSKPRWMRYSKWPTK